MIKILAYNFPAGNGRVFNLTAQHDGNIPVHGRKLILTGIHLSIPPGYVGHICPCPLLAHDGVVMLNPPVLWDKTDEIKLVLINHGDKPFDYQAGQVIAQMYFSEAAIEVEIIRGTKGAVTRE